MHNSILTNSLNISSYQTNDVVLRFGAYDDYRNADCITLQSGGKFTSPACLCLLYIKFFQKKSLAFKKQNTVFIINMKVGITGSGQSDNLLWWEMEPWLEYGTYYLW
jgi:hypothetical protein